jgi:hypothetical protein
VFRIAAFLSPLRGWLTFSSIHPRLAPWAAFFRRFAACFFTTAGFYITIVLFFFASSDFPANRPMRQVVILSEHTFDNLVTALRHPNHFR